MTRNINVLDTKPSNNSVFDQKSNNNNVIDAKPSNNVISTDFGQEQFYTVVFSKGQYMGIPPFTYPEAGTVQSSFSP